VSNIARIVIGVGVTLLVIIVAGLVFLRFLVTKSYPVTAGSLTVRGLHSPVEVFRDEHGVPHLRAADEHDLMIGAGYVHAQDRLWQMDVMRRAGEGRLSEIMGEPTVRYDLLFRTINLRAVADSIQAHLHPETIRILEAYAEGVNDFIDDHKGKYPIEFDMLNYEPEHWTVAHSILAARLMAWDLNLAWWTDLTYGEIAETVAPEKFRELIPAWPDSVPPTVPLPAPAGIGRRLGSLHAMLEAGRSYRDFFGLGSLEAGSNAWVVDSSKSQSGKPLLANDPHIALPSPSRWYEIHLSAPGWNVAGVSIPGTPLVIIGHNDRVAWGLTNAMIDDADFFVERVDSAHPGRYLTPKGSLPLTLREETIYIKPADSLIATIRTTRHGPVINDVHPSHLHVVDSLRHRDPLVAMSWTGFEVSDEMFGFYQMDKAANRKEFEEGVKEITVPAQSVLYGDVDGNIAYWTAGRVPIRHGMPMLPQPGWTGEADWKGFVPFEQLPHRANPPEGFLACANQKIADEHYYLSTLWEPPSRIIRIRQLLQSAEKFSAVDFQQFQQDVSSPYAHEMVHLLMAAYDSASAPAPEIREALNYLRNWDDRFTQGDIATTLFNAYFTKLLHRIYEDEMGKEVFNDFVFFGAIAYRVTEQLLSADSSAWFDDITTPQRETRDEIIRQSLSDAVGELRSALGPEMKNWRWGSVHTVTFHHLFGSRPPLGKIFDIGPFPVSGGGTTVAKTEYRMTLPYATSVGPSMRQVVDLATPESSFLVITSGESGQPLNEHYDDQTSLWLNGGYLQVPTDWDVIERAKWNRLTLRPE
jgi:penicillin amidase